MRMILLLFAFAVLALAADVRPAAAQSYPWCAYYGGGGAGGGGTNCGFSTWNQCMAAISGNGGYCGENPMYRPQAPGRRPDGRPRY